MSHMVGQESGQAEPFAAIKILLKYKTLVVWIGTVAVALVLGWLGYRTGFVDLYVLAVILAVATYGVLRVAIDVVELVVQTLMPQ